MRKRLFLLALFLPALLWAQGITWGPMIRVDDAPGLATHSAIHPYTIIDDSLNIYTVWEDDRDGNGRHSVYFAKSADLSASYSRPNVVVFNDSLYDNVYPWMVKGKSGAIYIVWQVKYQDTFWRVYFSKSTDGGNIFSPADTIKGPAIRNNKDDANNFGPLPRIAIDPSDSILYLVWTEATGSLATKVRCSRSLSRDADFSGMARVNVDSLKAAKHPAIITDTEGRVFVTYEQSNGGNTNDPQCDIFFNQSNDYGLTFGAVDLMINDNGDVARMQNPTIDRINDRTMVIWEDTRTGVAASNAQPVLFFSQKADTSAAFSVNVRVSDALSGDWNYRPRMAIDQTTGNMIVAWHSNIDTTDAAFELRLCAYNDTIDQFTPSYKMFDTYTGNSGENFGNIFYPPAVAITNIDSVANFFLIWRDLIEDTAGNIYSRHGRIVPVLPAADLENLKVFPNPFKYWLGHRAVNFEGLTQTATIKIYDIKGRLLTTIEENNGDGLATWTPESASGVYLYLVTNLQGHKKTGKIAILR